MAIENSLPSPRKGYLVATAIFVSLGCYMYGYDVGSVASILVMSTFNDRFHPSSAVQGSIVSIWCTGAFFGAIVAGWSSVTFGRKRTIAIGSVWALFGYALQTGSQSLRQYLAGRVISGVAIGLFTTVVPLYCSELAPPKVRGIVVGVSGVMTGIGFIGGQWTGYGCQFFPDDRQWRVTVGMQLAPAFLLFCGIHFLPFSPRWLLEKGREQEAHATLMRLRGSQYVTSEAIEEEFVQMKETIAAEVQRGKISDLWSSPSMRRRTFIACSATSFNQLTGIGITSYYGPLIYRALGIEGNKLLLLQGIYGAISAVANAIFVTFILDSVGRKKPLLFGSASMVCIFSIMAALIASFPPGEATNRAAQWSTIAMIFLVPVVFSMSWDPTSSLLASEVFPTHTRSIGMALAICCNWAFNIVLTQVSPIALKHISWRYYIVFVAANTVSFIVVLLFFPETKGRTLEDITISLGGEADSRSTASTKESIQLAIKQDFEEDVKLATENNI